jgi:hypothetical protein
MPQLMAVARVGVKNALRAIANDGSICWRCG